MNLLIKSFCQSRRYLQSLFLYKKLLSISKPEISTFSSILKSCSSLPSLDSGLVNHGYLIKCGVLDSCVDVGNDLVLMYLKLGEFRDAHKVFDEMPMRSNKDVFDHMIHDLGSNHAYNDVVIAFENMVEFSIFPNVHSLCHVIKACSNLNSIKKGNFVHDFIKQNGFENHLLIMNSLISMYAKMGRLDLAQNVFNNMIHKDIVSWNSLITGFSQNHNSPKVFNLFKSLKQAKNPIPNVVTFLALLSSVREVTIGTTIHSHLITIGLYSNLQLGTAIFNMYAKCERLDYALIVFEQINKTLVSWNTLISAYKQKGYAQEAVDIYEHMLMEPDMKPDSFSFANVLPAYASLGNLKRIKLIHSMIIKQGVNIDQDVVLCTSILDAYGKCSDVKAAEFLFLFHCIQKPNTASWNAMISVYNSNNKIKNSMVVFQEMICSKVLMDCITMVTIFQSCGQMGLVKEGNMIHKFSLMKGFCSYLIVGNALIDMYMRCGSIKSAEIFFDLMSLRNIVTWNTMIYGYMKGGCFSMGVRFFHHMQLEYKPDSVTIISLLQGNSGSFLEMFHGYILKLGLDFETQIINILIDSYAKIGNVDKAQELFERNDFKRDQTSWNIMIAAYGMNGQGIESCKLFTKMHENGYRPDTITFTSLLSACSHSGLIEEGCKFFDLMVTKYKIQPSMEHLTCVIDMLGRANSLKEAYDLMKNMNYQKPVLGALLSACRTNMNIEVGELVGRKLLEMESDSFEYHSLLSNLYSLNDKWDEVVEIRRVFGNGKVVKKLGLSSLNS
ncbi:putative pentatricopeptide repeat-containing protein At3g01580 [Lactuca sativa]|uniref:Pentacotripeptide-repeat region of PRORP domain-containing protein n=1 Tax=Lactuca sativa TaxID=4236 RepID=A0A9R1ULR0_LACSA|nr:putative pentatricopeptide repeat-containing protein At3g01580 [Lactuca sativa]KAJ0189449.1 hypothetical protein LSAT_V11C800430580 [Lactuca sativa]